jgi:GNAT superfamily N-acetyltransferase
MITIVRAETPEQIQHVRDLQAEYVAWDTEVTTRLGIDAALLQYQYSPAMLELPGDYIPPHGCLLLACLDGQPAGCAAFHRFEPGICELKRMYVRPAFRGHGIARRLLETLIQEAQTAGYSVMRLETAAFMEDAHKLYYSLDFQPVPPYYDIPEGLRPISVFMERSIRP